MPAEYAIQRIGITITISMHESLIVDMLTRIFMTQVRQFKSRPYLHQRSTQGLPCVFATSKPGNICSPGVCLGQKLPSNFICMALKELMQDEEISLVTAWVKSFVLVPTGNNCQRL